MGDPSDEMIDQCAQRVGDESGTPEEARQLLEDFVLRWEKGDTIPGVLLRHVADCLRNFLRGSRVIPLEARITKIDSLDKAFGLKRTSPGAPANKHDSFKEAAVQVLERRLEGMSLEKAVAATCDMRKEAGSSISSESQVTDAWVQHKLDAYLWLRASKDQGTGYWTVTEKKLLTKIFAKEEWFHPPPW